MGSAMARHVLDAGHDLAVWNRSTGKADELVTAGAFEAASPAEAAAGRDVVVLMLFGPDASREVLFGPEGAATGAAPGTLVIDATTVGPTVAREIGAELARRELRFVDAPVAGSVQPATDGTLAGSVQPATDGTLAVLAGGRDEDFADAKPMLELWGDPERIRHIGPVGAGNAAKVVANQALGVAIAGLGEALQLAADLGLDRAVVLDILAAGPYGRPLEQKRSMIESGDFSATAFSLDLMVKDLDLAVSETDVELPVTAAALADSRAAAAAGHGGEDYGVVAGYLADAH
jgi:3-hydroxyisobutyrate dehydrogenase-like beta-hydroxyacid dehydrogenase